MTQRQRGLQHMIPTKDNLLDSCHPADISWDRFLEDCERAINMSEFHSDEWSTDDAFLADEERKNKQRPVCSPPQIGTTIELSQTSPLLMTDSYIMALSKLLQHNRMLTFFGKA